MGVLAMRKLFVLAAAAALALVSCNVEQEVDTPVVPAGKTVVFSAELTHTRTALGDKNGSAYPVLWSAGDIVSVNGIASSPIDNSFAGTANAEFTVEGVSAPYYAAVPSSAFFDYSSGFATVNLPAEQTWVDGSYDPAAYLLIGKSSTESIAFNPSVALFSLTPVENNGLKFKSVKLQALDSNIQLAGEFVTDFETMSPGMSGTDYVTVSSVDGVSGGKPFILAFMPADFSTEGFRIIITDENGGTMTRTAKPNKAYEAGKIYSSSINYVADTAAEMTITAEGITSSTAVICWNESTNAAYTISVYSDADCATLVDSYAVPAGSSCWGDVSPRFCISGLTPGTAYYVKVVDPDNGKTSNVLTVTTEAFDIVEVSSTPAIVGDVLLAEDFGELRWDCDVIGNAVGFFPTSQTSFATTEVTSFQAADTSNEKVLGSQTDALNASRLAHWAQGANNNLYIHPGYIKLVGSSKVTHIVTPALDNIPDGMLATLEVKVTASAYYSGSSSSFATLNAIVAAQPAGTYNELIDDTKTNTLDLTSNVAPVTLLEISAWNEYTVTLTGVSKGARIAFGAAADVEKNNARMNLSDIKITVTELKEVGNTISASLKNVSSSTASFTWSHDGADAAFDISKPYLAAIYSDASCSNLVASYAIPAGSGCWDDRQPSFVFSGLTPSTDYWFKVTNTEANIESEPVACTTSAFTVVDATAVSNAGVGDVILAEDFSEIGWGAEELTTSAGFYPSPKTLYVPSGAYTTENGNFSKYNGQAGRIYGDCKVTSDKRLYNWGFFGNSSVYAYAGYLRVGTGSSGAMTHIVSPALAGIPDGKEAVIDVTVTSGQYKANDNDVAVFVEKDSEMSLVLAPDQKDHEKFSSQGGKYNGATLSKGYALNSKSRAWTTSTVRIKGVTNDTRLLFGSYENIDTKNRFFINDVIVTIVGIKDQGAVDAVMEISDFGTLKDFLTECGSGKTIQGNVTADISLSSAEVTEIDALYPIAEFDGILNGNDHTIAGLAKPLFDQLSGTVSNLTLESTLDISEAWNKVGILACEATDATISGCISKGSVTLSASAVSGDISLGGLIGIVSNCTLVSCQNQASVTNNAAADGTLRMGGLIGVADGANTLTGTSSVYNYNQGLLIDDSETQNVAVGGVCGFSDNAPSSFDYCKSLAPDSETDYDDIEIRNHTKNKVYVGGILGMSAVTSTLDYTYNKSDIKFTSLRITQTGQVFAGGIIGGWTASGVQTITGCTNSGWVYTKNSAGDLAAADSDALPKYWSCFAGIAGMGAGTSESLGSSWYTITGKTFTNCTNTGTVRIYAALRCCIAGVVAYTENNPDGCVSTASDIRPYLTGGIGKVGDNYHRNICGGVVGLCTASKVSNLKSTAKIVSQSSSPFAYTGGIIGYVPAGTIELENCKVSNHVQAAGSGDGRSALMCHVAQNAVTVTFTNCVVMKGTLSYATGSKVTISSSNLSAQHCVGPGSNYTITNDALPTVADSI